jgi:D-beta-D-heptose 7-phosphate kinase/D-beta-D-heptose 1-phosphate adenosyltransferase
MKILKSLAKVKGKKVLVVGDLMLDVYLSGRASRISPEAPVPVVTAQKRSLVPGGSANVVANLAELGCDVTVAGFVGKDDEGLFLKSNFEKSNVNADAVIDTSLPTICKTRVLANGQHIVRYDIDSDFNTLPEKQILLTSLRSLGRFDVVVVSDYNKGTIDKKVMSVIKTCFHCPVLCDIKPMNKRIFKDVWAIFPNLEEARQMAGGGHVDALSSASDIAQSLKNELSLTSVVITMADDGILGLDENGYVESFPAYTSIDEHDPRQRFDVTGAGDTVISVFAACIASGMRVKPSLFVSNIAAGIVVQKIGTAVCGHEELLHEIRKYASNGDQQ